MNKIYIYIGIPILLIILCIIWGIRRSSQKKLNQTLSDLESTSTPPPIGNSLSETTHDYTDMTDPANVLRAQRLKTANDMLDSANRILTEANSISNSLLSENDNHNLEESSEGVKNTNLGILNENLDIIKEYVEQLKDNVTKINKHKDALIYMNSYFNFAQNNYKWISDAYSWVLYSDKTIRQLWHNAIYKPIQIEVIS